MGITARPKEGLAWVFIVVGMEAGNVEQRIYKIHSVSTMCQDCSKEIHAPHFSQSSQQPHETGLSIIIILQKKEHRHSVGNLPQVP